MSHDAAECCLGIRVPTPRPFEVVELDWYDGVTAGLARCRSCGQAYAFDVVASSPDGLRVYGFARIAPAYYETMAALGGKRVPPMNDVQEWRDALAPVESRSPSHQADRDLFVLARDLMDEVIASRRVSFSVLEGIVRPRSTT